MEFENRCSMKLKLFLKNINKTVDKLNNYRMGTRNKVWDRTQEADDILQIYIQIYKKKTCSEMNTCPNLSKSACCIWPVCHCLSEPMYKMRCIMACRPRYLAQSSSSRHRNWPTRFWTGSSSLSCNRSSFGLLLYLQMNPDTAKVKCKNFLSTLLRLANDQPDSVASNVRMLIQDLVDAKVEPEEFTTKLQRELNSSPQPCLIPFLKVRIN